MALGHGHHTRRTRRGRSSKQRGADRTPTRSSLAACGARDAGLTALLVASGARHGALPARALDRAAGRSSTAVATRAAGRFRDAGATAQLVAETAIGGRRNALVPLAYLICAADTATTVDVRAAAARGY